MNIFPFSCLGVLFGFLILLPFGFFFSIGDSGHGMVQVFLSVWESLAFPLLIVATFFSVFEEGSMGSQVAFFIVPFSLPLVYGVLGYLLGKGFAMKRARLVHAVVGFFIAGMLYPLMSSSLLFSGSLRYAPVLMSMLPFLGAFVGGCLFPAEKRTKKGL